MSATIFSATQSGVNGIPVRVEAAHTSNTPNIKITGLAGDVVKESRQRVETCLRRLGFEIPTKEILVHLNPAGVKKQGSQMDVAIALSILYAEGYLSVLQGRTIGVLGELSLDGSIHRVRGSLSLVESLFRLNLQSIIVPRANGPELSVLKDSRILCVRNLIELLDFFHARADLDPANSLPAPKMKSEVEPTALPFDKIIGQGRAKRALVVAIAGRHHALMVGPPGVGKSLLATSASQLLPELEPEEWLSVARIWGHSPSEYWFRNRPYRSPHHSISAAGLLGGGNAVITPGEVSLSHRGVLFLDEFSEFRRDALEGLREPMQTGKIHLHRIGSWNTLDAKFTLLATMNPCPCGYQTELRCTCDSRQILSYRKRISGPILDRLDLCISVSTSGNAAESLTKDRAMEMITNARSVQRIRYGTSLIQNSDVIPENQLGFELGTTEQSWLDDLQNNRHVNHRSIHKTIQVARTIADLERREHISITDLREAWSFRVCDYFERVPRS